MIRHYLAKIGVFSVALSRLVGAQPTPQDLKSEVGVQKDALSMLAGDLSVRILKSTPKGMQIKEELSGNFVVAAEKRFLCYLSNDKRVTYAFDGRISSLLREKEGGAEPVGYRWVGVTSELLRPRRLTPPDLTLTLFGQELTRFDFVPRDSDAAIIGETRPAVGYSKIYRIQVHDQEGDLVTAFAVAPDPGRFAYALLEFDSSKGMAMVQRNLYTRNDVLKEEMTAADHVQIGDAWLPRIVTVTQYTPAASDPKVRQCTEIRYSNVKALNEMTNDMFSLGFPIGTHLEDMTLGPSGLVER